MFVVTIEETISKSFSFPEAKSMEEAMDMAAKMYKAGELVLEEADVTHRQMACQAPNGETTDWGEF